MINKDLDFLAMVLGYVLIASWLVFGLWFVFLIVSGGKTYV